MSGPTREELAQALRAKARAAATTALREGLVDIDERYGQHVADEVVGLLDLPDLFDGLLEPGRETDDDADEKPYELNTKFEW